MFKICLCNLESYNKGKVKADCLDLPFNEDELKNTLNEIGVEESKDFFILNYENDFNISISKNEDILKLNKAVERLESLNYKEMEVFKALSETLYYKEYEKALKNINKYELYPEIKTEEDFGRFKLFESGDYEVPEYLEDYIDIELWGADNMYKFDGDLTEYGWVERLE